ncbi:MAG: dihydropteroate synthase [Candidatus Omnitrophica bacterium]|nr:dihydropteroate synthase [Candidatus Omnitrophota bacterium]
MQFWNICGKTVNTKRFMLMGILNITPDSFYSGSRYPDFEKAVERAKEMADEGADIIDIGGESTRPGSEKIFADEETERVAPLIKLLSKETDVLISCDTYKYKVAEKAIEAGASIINDISAFSMDGKLLDIVKDSGCGYVLMHMKGTPADMQKAPFYQDAVSEIYNFLDEKLKWMADNGINPQSVVVDTGIGFGKRPEDNLSLLNNLDRFKKLGRPVMVGTSRKSFIGKILSELPAEERLEGSLASAVLAYAKGASIFRVHDVKETGRALAVADAILHVDKGRSAIPKSPPTPLLQRGD